MARSIIMRQASVALGVLGLIAALSASPPAAREAVAADPPPSAVNGDSSAAVSEALDELAAMIDHVIEEVELELAQRPGDAALAARLEDLRRQRREFEALRAKLPAGQAD